MSDTIPYGCSSADCLYRIAAQSMPPSSLGKPCVACNEGIIVANPPKSTRLAEMRTAAGKFSEKKGKA